VYLYFYAYVPLVLQPPPQIVERIIEVPIEIQKIVKVEVRYSYGVPSISRLLKIIGLFCRISSLL